MKPLHWTLLLLPASWFALVGCGGQPAAAPQAVEVVVAAPAVAAQAQGGGWGDITGRITWGGDKLPPQLDLDLKENTDKPACLKNGPVKDESFVVNPKNKGMRNVFVWLEGATK